MGINNSDDIEDLLAQNVSKRDGEDENTIISVNIGQSPLAPRKPNQVILNHGGKNLDQYFVDNPPMRQHGATMITDQVFLGTAETACDGNFIRQNYVSHILNTNGKVVPNVYDPLNFHNREVKAKLDETKQVGSKLIGSI